MQSIDYQKIVVSFSFELSLGTSGSMTSSGVGAFQLLRILYYYKAWSFPPCLSHVGTAIACDFKLLSMGQRHIFGGPCRYRS